MLVTDIRDWVAQVLPHTVGILEWTSFNKKFGPQPSSAGESSFDLHLPRPQYHFSFSLIVTRSLTVMTTCKSIRTTASFKVPALHRPSRRAAAPSTGTTTSSLLYLVDESSPSDEEAVPLKRRRGSKGEGAMRGELKLIVPIPEADVASNAEISIPDAEIAPLPEVSTVAPRSDPSTFEPIDIPSSAEERGKGMTVDDSESCSDVDPKKEKMFVEGVYSG